MRDDDSQKARMLRGDLYRPDDPDLVEDHRRCRRLLERFNACGVDDQNQAQRLLHELLGRFGQESVIRPPFHCDYGSQIHIGDRTFINYNTVILDCASVTIGDDVQIASGVQILTPTPPLDPDIRRSGLESAHPVTIESGAWLGAGAIILPGVRIGQNSVVGAGSVVTRDLPSGVLAFGNPCRVVRDV